MFLWLSSSDIIGCGSFHINQYLTVSAATVAWTLFLNLESTLRSSKSIDSPKAHVTLFEDLFKVLFLGQPRFPHSSLVCMTVVTACMIHSSLWCFIDFCCTYASPCLHNISIHFRPLVPNRININLRLR